MYAGLQNPIIFSADDICRIHAAKIEERPLLPAFLLAHLHFNIDFLVVVEMDLDIQDPCLVLLVAARLEGIQQFQIHDFLRRNVQQGTQQSLKCFLVVKYMLESKIIDQAYIQVLVTVRKHLNQIISDITPLSPSRLGIPLFACLMSGSSALWIPER